MAGKCAAGCLLALSIVNACGLEKGRSEAVGRLSEGAVGMVAGERIDGRTIQRIVEAQGVSAAVAFDRAVFDALFAEYAKERLWPSLSRHARRSAAARALLEDFARQASQQGPPTDAEVDAATERRFWELDRPELLRTTHAVVLVKKSEDDAPARALAARVASAVSGARDPTTFRRRAESVPAGGLELRVEDVDPVARDGRAVNPAAPPPPGSAVAHLSAAYVDAAFAIPDVGATSPVVRTEFGYHVILAVERIPEARTPLEDRRHLLGPEILGARAEKLRDDALALARQSAPVEVERAAIELTEALKIGP